MAEKERIKTEIIESRMDLNEFEQTAELSTKVAEEKWEEVRKTEDQIQELTTNLANLQALYE